MGAVGLIMMVELAGCGPSGPELVDVQGVVTLDGKPLDRATIIFQPKEGRASVGTTDADGAYRLKYTNARYGALPGDHTVRITSQVLFTEGQANSGRPELLPQRYHEKTELTANVSSDDPVINFDLESK